MWAWICFAKVLLPADSKTMFDLGFFLIEPEKAQSF
jgi:hypothetical protein